MRKESDNGDHNVICAQSRLEESSFHLLSSKQHFLSKFYLFFSLYTSEPCIRQIAFPGVLTETKMASLWSGPLPLKDQKIQDHCRQCLPQEK